MPGHNIGVGGVGDPVNHLDVGDFLWRFDNGVWGHGCLKLLDLGFKLLCFLEDDPEVILLPEDRGPGDLLEEA